MNKDALWKVLERNSDWIKFSDVKAGVIITVYGIIISIIYSNATDVYVALKNNWLPILLFISAGCCTTVSIIFAFKCINPRLKNNKSDSNLYFGSIAKNYSKFEDYRASLKNVNYKEDLEEQVYTTSKIANDKFINVTWCIRFFTISIGILLVNISIHLIK